MQFVDTASANWKTHRFDQIVRIDASLASLGLIMEDMSRDVAMLFRAHDDDGTEQATDLARAIRAKAHRRILRPNFAQRCQLTDLDAAVDVFVAFCAASSALVGARA
jgi:hypothetical protein